jgi:hypothetical protein
MSDERPSCRHNAKSLDKPASSHVNLAERFFMRGEVVVTQYAPLSKLALEGYA